MSHSDEFIDAMRTQGLAMHRNELMADGLLHRYRVEGDKPGSLNGWYVLDLSHPAHGAFGSWKTGQSVSWCPAHQTAMSENDRRALARRQAATRAARYADQVAMQKSAQNRAAKLWEAAKPAKNKHPYLLRKGVGAFGIRQMGDRLVIPLRDDCGAIWSIQFIDSGGGKRFLSGGRKKGCYFSIGEPRDALCICEGYATGASVYMSTGHATAIAFDAGNLASVAAAMRKKFPELKIIIVADYDADTEGNPGMTYALDAARAIGALVAFPIFEVAI